MLRLIEAMGHFFFNHPVTSHRGVEFPGQRIPPQEPENECGDRDNDKIDRGEEKARVEPPDGMRKLHPYLFQSAHGICASMFFASVLFGSIWIASCRYIFAFGRF